MILVFVDDLVLMDESEEEEWLNAFVVCLRRGLGVIVAQIKVMVCVGVRIERYAIKNLRQVNEAGAQS